jgi:hypothetical protein
VRNSAVEIFSFEEEGNQKKQKKSESLFLKLFSGFFFRRFLESSKKTSSFNVPLSLEENMTFLNKNFS